MIRFRSPEDYDPVPLEKGDHWIRCGISEFPLFVKKNHPVLLCPGGESSETLDDRTFTALCMADRDVSYDLYRDNGTNPAPTLCGHLTKAVVPLAAQGSSPVPGVAISSLVL